MELRRIEYKNVYGHLSDSLDFEQGENFLVGINGCGKTTVLNLIRWMLVPSLPDLCTVEHDLISLKFKYDKFLYTLQSTINKNTHELKIITKDKTRNFHPITTSLHIHPAAFKGGEDRLHIRDAYSGLSPEYSVRVGII